jgi:hypothetical protein
MSQRITIELSEEAYAALQRQADEAGVTPSDRLRADAEHLYHLNADAKNGAGQPSTGNLRAVIERHFPGTLGPRDDRSEVEKEAAREQFRRLIGAFRSGRPSGANNELIDADLAREYGNNHEYD